MFEAFIHRNTMEYIQFIINKNVVKETVYSVNTVGPFRVKQKLEMAKWDKVMLNIAEITIYAVKNPC